MMNKKEILKKVGAILTELNEQYDYLSQSPENLNELELELFSANANFLSDHLSILVKLNDNTAKAEEPVKAEPQESRVHPESEGAGTEATPVEEPVPDTSGKETLPDWKSELEKEPGMRFEFEEKPGDAGFDRTLTEDESRVADEKPVSNTMAAREEDYVNIEEESHDEIEEEIIENKEEPAGDVHVKEVVISERTIAVPEEPRREEKPIPTVNDLLSKNTSQETVASQFNFLQSKDLKGMISLNDKLMFVRDLFNGYSLAYSEALELLNRFDNFEAADNFLKQNYASKNNWADKQDVTDKFYEILSRRFSK